VPPPSAESQVPATSTHASAAPAPLAFEPPDGLPGWRQTWRLYASLDRESAEIRAGHLRAVVALTPASMTGNLVIGALLTVVFRGAVPLAGLVGWWAALLAVCGSSAWCWRRHARHRPARVGRRLLLRSAAHAAGLAAVWVAVPIAVGGAASTDQRVLLLATVTGLIAGGGFVLCPLPLAAIVHVVVLAAGTGIALAAHGAVDPTLLGLLVAYTATVVAAVLLGARRATAALRDAREARHQSHLVTLLLRDFEAQSAAILWETDTAGRLVRTSPKLLAVMGVDAAQASAQPLLGWFESHADGDDGRISAAQLRQALDAGKAFRNLEMALRVGGQTRWWSLAARPLVDDSGSDQGWRGVIADITVEHQVYARLNHLALFDSLTGLANRMQLRDRLHLALEHALHRPTALLCLDMDNFKWVNDGFGHGTGDQILRETGARLQALVRGKDLVARAGGDEFAVLLDEMRQPADVQRLGQRIVEELHRPFFIGGRAVRGGVSVGVVMLPAHGRTVDEVLANADLALGAAKAAGRGRCELFHADMGERVRLRISLERELREALARHEMTLHWQPQVDTRAWRIGGCEALLRWQHPRLGLVPPLQFIPIAEESGFIVELGEWVLQEACRVGAKHLPGLTVNVNASPLQLVRDDFPQVVRRALTEARLDPHRLEIEITESLFIDASPKALKNLETLRQMGVRVALDDFGTGYSSLAYLRQFPFDTLKIDRAFVRELVTQRDARAIVKSIMDLARALGMSTVAEGVEEPAQYDLLCRAGCEYVQGYLIAKPMPIAEVRELIDSWAVQRAPQTESVPDSIFGALPEEDGGGGVEAWH
jgi:diguanylate cyclase (GGDEF)-like protein/PAS domain S-box-containing protein